jgi:hypothetical protein
VNLVMHQGQGQDDQRRARGNAPASIPRRQ